MSATSAMPYLPLSYASPRGCPVRRPTAGRRWRVVVHLSESKARSSPHGPWRSPPSICTRSRKCWLMQKRNTALRKEIMCTRRCWGTENRRWIIGISERNAYLGGHQSAYKDKHCVPTGRRTPHPHGFLQTWRPYRTLGLRLSVSPQTLLVPNRQSKINNQKSLSTTRQTVSNTSL